MKIAFILLVSVFCFSCSRDEVVQPSSPVEMLNVKYGSDPLQAMDVYLPAIRSSDTTKSIIMIHGGGWSGGDKADFTQYVTMIRSRMPEYAVFNINYRLAVNPSTLFPTQENDVKAAIQFIHTNRSSYRVAEKFILLGASAGAHLAILQAYKHPLPYVKAVVDLFGPTDMTAMYNDPAPFAPPSAIAAVIGSTPVGNPAAYFNASPINFVTSNSPPTIILHGGMDPLVKLTQSETLRTLLQQQNVAHEFVFYPNEGHGWLGITLDDTFNKIYAFLRTHVQ